MPVPKSLKDEIRRAIRKEYPTYSLKRRNYITNAVIYGKMGYGRKKWLIIVNAKKQELIFMVIAQNVIEK